MDAFDEDRVEVIQRSKALGLKHILLPNVDVHSIASMCHLASTDQDFFRIMAGIHPCYVQDMDTRDQLDQIVKLIKMPGCVAIGEIGLDLHWDSSTLELQKDMLRRQMELAHKHQLPVVLHSRDAFEETLEVVQEYPEVTGIFHCFTGNLNQALRAINAGYYLGIGGVVTFKKSGLIEILSSIGLDRILLETDAPYLAPVPYRGKRNEPAFLNEVVNYISMGAGMDYEHIVKATSHNTQALFRL